ncbi:MAG TPA: T9SS type A sorting domain-containing protein [Candidatus Kapabacteria bacterium]
MKARIISFIFFSLLSSSALSQWSNVADRLLGDFPSSCCGFGHITYKDGRLWAGRSSLFVSNDTGKTWTFVNGFNGTICQIDFIDKMTGVVGTTGGVYKTVDGGITWRLILDSRDCYTAQFCGDKNMIIAISDYNGFFYSSNGGASWNFFDPVGHPHFAIAKKDGSAFAFNDGSGGNLLYTNDNGLTYYSSGGLDGDCFFGALDSNDNVYVVNEGGHVDNDGKSVLYKSTDNGNTWKQLTSKVLRYYSAGISIGKCAMYVQTRQNGIERSLDEGVAWEKIGGPSNEIDTRTICAIDDNVIIASDHNGSIWKTTNSGGKQVSIGPKVEYNLRVPKGVVEKRHSEPALIPIYLKRSLPVPTLEFKIYYDSNDYEHVGTFTLTGDRVDVPSESIPGRIKVRFPASALLPNGDSLIGYSQIKIYAYEPFCSQVRYDSARFDATFASCEGAPQIFGSVIKVGNYNGCGGAVYGVDDVNVASIQFTIHPNPAHEKLTLTSNTDARNTKVYIIDVLGRTLIERDESFVTGQHLELSLSPLAAGTYYMRIETSERVQTIRFVKE